MLVPFSYKLKFIRKNTIWIKSNILVLVGGYYPCLWTNFIKNYSLFKFSQGSISTPMCHITLIMKIFFSSWRYPGSISINGILIVNIFILEFHDINRTIFHTQERRRVLHNLCKNKMNQYRHCAKNLHFLIAGAVRGNGPPRLKKSLKFQLLA